MKKVQLSNLFAILHVWSIWVVRTVRPTFHICMNNNKQITTCSYHQDSFKQYLLYNIDIYLVLFYKLFCCFFKTFAAFNMSLCPDCLTFLDGKKLAVLQKFEFEYKLKKWFIPVCLKVSRMFICVSESNLCWLIKSDNLICDLVTLTLAPESSLAPGHKRKEP